MKKMKLENSKLQFKDYPSMPSILILENCSTNAEISSTLNLSLDPMENQKVLLSLNSPRSHLSTKPLNTTELTTWVDKSELKKLEETPKNNNKEEMEARVS